jgi:putative oxidoreductase
MDRLRSQEVGKLVLRLVVGGLLLLHGIHKLRHGIGGIVGLVESKGLPGFIAYGAYIGEVAAPIAVILGILARLGGLVIAINMAMAIFLAQSSKIFTMKPTGGLAIELELLLLFGGLAIALLGSGHYSVTRGRDRLD